MNSISSLLVIGGGLAGAKAVQGAREAGFAGRVWLIGDEPVPPYERPPLSKEILRGEKPLHSSGVHDDTFYSEHDVELVLDDAVDALDVSARSATLRSGRTLAFDAAVLATGAEPRRLALPGVELAGVHYLRTVADAERLSADLAAGTRVAVVGAGWIGSEVAASARQLGRDVVLIEPGPLPLVGVLGTTVGEVFRDLHADHGVTLRLGTAPTAFRGASRVEEVLLNDGSTEAADVVVIGVGALPRTSLAVDAGLDVDEGVVVDSFLRTSAPGVLAAGDIARAWHPRFQQYIRVEHWANALNQGLAVGGNAVGAQNVYDRLPYFYSDQYDLGLEYVGYAERDSDVTIRGDLAARQFIAFYHRDRVVTAALAVNTWDVVEDLKAMVSAGAPADLERLQAVDVPLA
jgi:3-phenylpropionate/trans-cinnamate dioxygenase ferredoxin reductase subunit